jgi:hypothetical protein
MSLLYSDPRDAVSFVNAIGNVIVDVATDFLEKKVQHRRAVRAVHIIITKDEYLLTAGKGSKDARGCCFHALHQEGVVQVLKAWSEIRLGLLVCINPAIDENVHRCSLTVVFKRTPRKKISNAGL